MADQPKCGFLDQLFGNAIVCSETFKDYQTASGQAEIQSAADNTAKYYGSDSVSAQVAQASADAQKKAFTGDVNAIDLSIENSTFGKVFGADCDGNPGIDLSFVGAGCIKYSTLKIAGLVVGGLTLLGVVLYALGIARSILSNRG
jgi:hypothetical protein